MTTERAVEIAKMSDIEIGRLIGTLAAAVEASDLFLNSYCVCKPSRIKAETKLVVEEAMGLLRARS